MTTSIESLARRASALALRNGWEVLRTLSHGDRELRQLVSLSGSPQPAQLCVRAAGAPEREATIAEIEALRATRSEHVLKLIEVLPPAGRRGRASGGPPPALVLEHAPGGDLEVLLERRDSIRAGEASTILLSVARGLEALHRSGWAHGALTTQCVVFRRDGCPAIASLENARPVSLRSVYDDRTAFLELAEKVSGSVARGEGARMLAAVRGALGVSGWEGVAHALIGAAEPEAVLLPYRAAEPDAAEPVDGRLGMLVDGHPVAALVGAMRAWARTRKKVIAFALAPVAAVAVVLALLPAPDDPGRQGGADHSPTAVSPTGPRTPEADELARAEKETETESRALPSTAPESADDAGDTSDDPIRTAEGLLRTRHACFVAERPVTRCLEASVQVGSPLFLSDSAALETAGAADERDLRGFALGLEQQWGDAVLLSVTPPTARETSEEGHAETGPASLLMVRSEAGWRLREVYRY
ncbi:protein kinase [Leifsonia sp. NPDC058230]|uniref:protein kinase n=1 Tax=Leifsonia sp. NPDC058230 TaxID=3346391 RepID=UPI0036DD035F